MKPETLTFDDLEPYLLLKNGNYLYKVPYGDDFAVIKVYYGSRPTWETWAKSFGNVVFEGQTSYMPLTRKRVERDCLALWKSHGFRVFGLHDHLTIKAPQCPERGYLVFEYVDAPKLVDVMPDTTRPLEQRLTLWNRFLEEWGTRHAIAIRDREPRLVHENGDAKHVMLLPGENGEEFGGELLWFDFEMVFRSRGRVEEYVGHEIVQYLWQLLRQMPEDEHDALLDATVANYPHPRFLQVGWSVFHDHPRLPQRLGRALDKRRARSKKPSSKYRVADRLLEKL